MGKTLSRVEPCSLAIVGSPYYNEYLYEIKPSKTHDERCRRAREEGISSSGFVDLVFRANKVKEGFRDSMLQRQELDYHGFKRAYWDERRELYVDKDNMGLPSDSLLAAPYQSDAKGGHLAFLVYSDNRQYLWHSRRHPNCEDDGVVVKERAEADRRLQGGTRWEFTYYLPPGQWLRWKNNDNFIYIIDRCN